VNETVPLHAVDLELAHAALGGEPLALRRLAERLAFLPRLVRALAAQAGTQPADSRVPQALRMALAGIAAELDRFGGERTLEAFACDRCRAAVHATLSVSGESQRAVELRRALESLPPHEARALRARHFEAIPAESLALRLSVTQKALTEAYVRGLERLSSWLSAGEPGVPMRAALRTEQIELLDRMTLGEAGATLAADAEVEAALSQRRTLQAELDVLGRAERETFKLARTDPVIEAPDPGIGSLLSTLLAQRREDEARRVSAPGAGGRR
jgi:hypothetical protein